MKILDLLLEDNQKKLKDVAEVTTNNPDAHFWVIRRGTKESVGKPTKEFNPEHFGISVYRPDIIYPELLYYTLMYVHSQGFWESVATGSLRLVHIRKSDLENLSFTPR